MSGTPLTIAYAAIRVATHTEDPFVKPEQYAALKNMVVQLTVFARISEQLLIRQFLAPAHNTGHARIERPRRQYLAEAHQVELGAYDAIAIRQIELSDDATIIDDLHFQT